jgi:hypothetical protein
LEDQKAVANKIKNKNKANITTENKWDQQETDDDNDSYSDSEVAAIILIVVPN